MSAGRRRTGGATRLLAGLFAFIAGIQTVRWSPYALDPKLLALNFLPLAALVFLAGARTFRKWRDFHAPLLCVAIVAIASWGAVTAFVVWMLPFSDVVAVSKYQEMLTAYPARTRVRHFPKAIPSEATNVEFVYSPAFVDGTDIKLRYTTTPEEMSRIQRMITPEEDLEDLGEKRPGWDLASARDATYRYYQFRDSKIHDDDIQIYGIAITRTK